MASEQEKVVWGLELDPMITISNNIRMVERVSMPSRLLLDLVVGDTLSSESESESEEEEEDTYWASSILVNCSCDR